jgi:hypothetical protein
MLILSGMVKTQRYPFTAAQSATPMPVLPEVFSTMVPPFLMRPSRSALSRMNIAILSLTAPPGFMNSHLA